MGMKFQATVYDPKNVMLWEDCTVVINGKSFKIITANGTTITLQLSVWDRISNAFRVAYWKTIEIIDELIEWAKDVIRSR